MLDVLLSQAAARWAFDPADGIQVVNAERLTATPIEPTRPLLIVPAETLLAPGTSASPTATTRSAKAMTPAMIVTASAAMTSRVFLTAQVMMFFTQGLASSRTSRANLR